MNTDLPNLLQRWRDGALTAEEMQTLNTLLATPDGREGLRRDWFIESALPQALAAASIAGRAPQPSGAARLRGWLTGLPGTVHDEARTLAALRMWARASFAALVLSGAAVVAVTLWMRSDAATPPPGETEPAGIAQLMLEAQLTDSP